MGGWGGTGGNGGIGVSGTDFALVNNGSIVGGKAGLQGNGGQGGRGGNGGNGGDGVPDDPTVATGLAGGGGDGGDGGLGSFVAASSGAGVSGSSFTLVNKGSIAGGDNNAADAYGGYGGAGGAAGQNGQFDGQRDPSTADPGDYGRDNSSLHWGLPGPAGAGVVSTGNATITNAGTISGGLATLAGFPDYAVRANAVELSGGGNSLVLAGGYDFIGNVVSTSGTGSGGDALKLGGTATASFDVGQVAPALSGSLSGTQYVGFSSLSVIGGDWAVTGINASSLGWALDGGVLSIGDARSLEGVGPDALLTTFDGGTLRTTTSMALSGNMEVLSGGGTFEAAAGTTARFEGVLSGDGTFSKSGSGGLILTGNSSAFTGTTVISVGRLAVNGALGGTIDIAGGTLGGRGTIGAVTVGRGGTLAPGNSIGTLNVGSATFDSGSTYTVELKNGGNTAGVHNDFVNAAGTVTIDGGTVHVKPENGMDDGFTYAPDTTYTIIAAAGGISGGFASLTDDYAFLNFALSYDPNNVYLTSQLAAAFFCLPGMTANQCAVSDAALSLGSGSLFMAVANLSNAEAPRALDQLSGEIHASAKTALIEDSRFLREAAVDRLRDALDGVGASKAPVMAYGDGGPELASATTDRLAVWGRGFGAWGSWDGDGNAANLDRSIGGFFIGADAPVFDNGRFGAVAGYSRSNFNVKDRNSSGASDNYYLGLYGGIQWGNLAFRSGAAYTWNDISTSRSVSFPGFSDRLTGDYNAGTTQVFGELAYGVNAGPVALEPFANLAWVNLSTNSFTEQGGAAALEGLGGSMDMAYSTLGLHASTDFTLEGVTATARGSLSWRHAFGDVKSDSTLAFANGGSPFSITGSPIAKDAAVVEAGVDFAIADTATLGFSYSGQFASGMTDQSIGADLAVKF
ncbi:Outer membrane autotransporter barrel domain protein (fragment) [Mesorhizobium sp. ORS 3324]